MDKLPGKLLDFALGRVGTEGGRGGLRETNFIPRIALPARSSRPSQREGEAAYLTFTQPNKYPAEQTFTLALS